jgi:hypothetical protein
MTELGDRLREFAALCDGNPKFTAAGIIVRPHDTIVAAFADTEERAVEHVAMAISAAVSQAPEKLGYFDEAV